jgi:Tfp pilus assembly pilus retraction ATPase PilT
MEIGELFKQVVGKGALDLHLTVLSMPVCRIDGVLTAWEDLLPLIPKPVTPGELASMVVKTPTEIEQ